MSARNLIFSDSSDDEGAGARSGDSSGILVKTSSLSRPPSGPSSKEKVAPPKDDLAGSRGSSSSQLRHSANRLSSRVSRKNSKGSGGGKPLVTSSFNFSAWVGATAQTTVTVVEQALVQAFRGESYMGTCLAAISVPNTTTSTTGTSLPGSAPVSPKMKDGSEAAESAAPSLVVEDSKGVLLCKLSLSTTVLTQDPQRPQYVYVERDVPQGGTQAQGDHAAGGKSSTAPERWTLMFQGQQELTKFFVSSTAALAASQRLLAPCQQSQKAVSLYQSPAGHSTSTSATTTTSTGGGCLVPARRGCEVHVSYTLWRLESISSPAAAALSSMLRVGDVVEDVPKEVGMKVIVGEAAWIRGMEEALVGMKPGSVKIVCLPAAAYTEYTATAAAAAAAAASSGSGQSGSERRPSSVRRGLLGSGGGSSSLGPLEPHTLLAAWISCIGVTAGVPRPTSRHRDSSKSAALTHCDPTALGNVVSTPQNLQETLASIQQQIASLQQCVTQISSSSATAAYHESPSFASPRMDSMSGRSISSSAAATAADDCTPTSGNVAGLDQTVMVAPRRRSKTPMITQPLRRQGSSCGSTAASGRSTGEAEAAMAQSCTRSIKRLCNDIYLEVERTLSSSSSSGGCEAETGDGVDATFAGLSLCEEDRQRVLDLVASCIHRKGQDYVQKWKRRAAAAAGSPVRNGSGVDALAERSPAPCVPRELSNSWTPLRHVTDPNAVSDPHLGRKAPAANHATQLRAARRVEMSGSLAPSVDIDDAATEGSCSVFRTPPPRAAMRLGSQDYRCSPTPPPLNFD